MFGHFQGEKSHTLLFQVFMAQRVEMEAGDVPPLV